MTEEPHPHLYYFLKIHFGLDAVPCWWKHRRKLIAAVHRLWDIQQSCYYQGVPRSVFMDARRATSMGFRIKYRHLDILFGVVTTDLANGYGCLTDYLAQGDTKLHRSTR